MRGRRAGEWTGEMTSGRIQTRVLHGRKAQMWSGLLLAPQCATVPPPGYKLFTRNSTKQGVLNQMVEQTIKEFD